MYTVVYAISLHNHHHPISSLEHHSACIYGRADTAGHHIRSTSMPTYLSTYLGRHIYYVDYGHAHTSPLCCSP